MCYHLSEILEIHAKKLTFLHEFSNFVQAKMVMSVGAIFSFNFSVECLKYR